MLGRGMVGCSAQYFSHTDDSTCKIKVLTCENILRELHRDPLLMRYSAVMIDQVDDRDAFMDILFGAVQNIKMKRPNLHIVLCASTTAAVKLKDFFDGNYMPDKSCVDEGTGNFKVVTKKFFKNYLRIPPKRATASSNILLATHAVISLKLLFRSF